MVNLSYTRGLVPLDETKKEGHSPEPPVSGQKPATSTTRSIKALGARAKRRNVEKTEPIRVKQGRVNQTQWTNYEGIRHRDEYH